MKARTSYFDFFSPRSFRGLTMMIGATLLALLTGCGGDSSKTPTPTPSSTAVQVNIGDAPADWLLAFSMNVSSMSLQTAGGGNVAITNSATPVEMIHRLGTMEPVALVNAVQGTYTGATMVIASCNFSYINPNTGEQVQKKISGPFNVSIPFSSSTNLSNTPLAFNFDLDLEHSLTTDESGAFQFTPQFHTSVGALNSTGNGVNARYGGMYQLMGVVNGISASSFNVKAHQAAHTFTFQISNETQFQGRITEMSQLGNGMGVMVTATLRADGSFLAKQVRATMGPTGAMGGGIVTSVVPPTGQPATEFTIVMQNGAGASVLTDYLSMPITVTIQDSTTFEIDTDRVSLNGLPFTPVFDRSNINIGQSVIPFSESGIVASSTCDASSTSCGTIEASTVRLREQGFRGTATVDITPGNATTFTLTLMPDCAFTKLTGATEIQVIQQATSLVEQQTAISAGTTLRVHGLLFNNGGQWILIASTISSS